MEQMSEIRERLVRSIAGKEVTVGINRDVLAAVVFLIGTALYASEVASLPAPFERGNAGPALYPAFLTGVMVISSAYLLITGLRKEAKITIDLGKYTEPAAYVLLTAIYVEIFASFGYVLSTLLYTFGVAIVFEFGNRKPLKLVGFCALVAVIVTGAGYLFFEVIFNVRLPGGLFGGIL